MTDYSNASRTMLFDIHKLRWDDELCELLGVPPRRCPSRARPRSVYGETDPDAFLGGAARSRAWRATSRRRCSARPALEPGLGKNTYGTGSFVLQNAGPSAPPPSRAC